MAVVRRGWVQHEHAEADEGVAEEDRDGEQNHDEEDVNFLAEGAVCKGDCEVCVMLACQLSAGLGMILTDC